VKALPANNWIAPLESRSSANVSLPCGRESISRPATEVDSPVSSPAPSSANLVCRLAASSVRSNR